LFSKEKKEVAVDKLDTLIGKDTRLEGTVQAKGTVRIDGQMEGQVYSQGDVIIGDTGQVKGEIKARNIFISGAVQGNVYAEEKLELSPSGSLLGDMQASKLVVDEGAVFDGNCIMQKNNSSNTRESKDDYMANS